MARRMALYASRVFLISSSDCLRGTALASKSTRTPAIEHGRTLRTYAAKAAKSKSASTALVGVSRTVQYRHACRTALTFQATVTTGNKTCAAE